jgi:hypothetical protein
MKFIRKQASSVIVGGGTKCKHGPLCRLVRVNPQWPGISDLFSESKITRFNFLMDLKEQSTRCDKQTNSSDVHKILRLIDLEIKRIFGFINELIRDHI